MTTPPAVRVLAAAALAIVAGPAAAQVGPVVVEGGWAATLDEFEEPHRVLGRYASRRGEYIGVLVNIPRIPGSVFANLTSLVGYGGSAGRRQIGFSAPVWRTGRESLVRPVFRVGGRWSTPGGSPVLTLGGGVYIGRRHGAVVLADYAARSRRYLHPRSATAPWRWRTVREMRLLFQVGAYVSFGG